jgi:biopolymer transport protein TolR
LTTFQALVVTVKGDDLMFFNNQPVTLDGLQKALETAARDGRTRELIIKADRQVRHGLIVQIMGVALKAGISTVNMATRPEVPGPGGTS